MKRKNILKLLPFIMASSITLSGCGEKSECELPNRHVHLYTKEINSDITISKYKDSEYLSDMNGYNWNPDYIEINKQDESFYKKMSDNGLFDAYDNFDYLYYEMSNNHDYLEYYYEEEKTETYTVKDSNGNEHEETRTYTETGWTHNRYNSNNTGKVRLNHHKYHAYRIEMENGNVKVLSSPDVDDIREVLPEYPYVKENGYTTYSQEFYFNKWDLYYLEAEDFYDYNGHPDLTNKTPYLNKTK